MNTTYYLVLADEGDWKEDREIDAATLQDAVATSAGEAYACCNRGDAGLVLIWKLYADADYKHKLATGLILEIPMTPLRSLRIAETNLTQRPL